MRGAAAAAGAAATGGREARKIHTRMGKISLALSDSRVYWRRSQAGVDAGRLVDKAFDERWYGSKARTRVIVLHRAFAERFDPFPEALDVLRAWRGMDFATHRLISS